MPATNAVSERSFSATRRLYTYLKINMGSSRLNNVMVYTFIKFDWTNCQWLM